MGLDIYLTEITEQEQEKRHSEESSALWERRENGEITEEEWSELYDKITPYPNRWEGRSYKSERYPDHLFDRRYLRSSYNDSGFNHAVPEMLGHAGVYPYQHGSLYWIFEPMERDWDGDEGRIDADDILKLEDARRRAGIVAGELKDCDSLRVMTISANQLTGLDWLQIDSDRALEIYRKEAERTAGRDTSNSPFGSAYSSSEGEFFGEKGWEFLAAIPGGEKMFFNEDRWPAVHMIYRSEALDSYIQSAEIVVEFIDEAIELIKRDGAAYISWSG